MECRDIEQYLPFLGDGSIPPDIEQEVREHISSCQSCRTEYDRVQHVFSLVHTAYEETPSVDLLGSIRQGIEHRNRERRSYRFMFSAAAAVIIAVSVYFTVGFEQNRNSVQNVAESGEDYYDYLAEQYFSTYELLAVADDIPLANEYDISFDLAMETGYIDISVNDIIENMGEEQFGEILRQTYF